MTQEWTRVADALPPDGEVVETKIDDLYGRRNEQRLSRSGRLWFLSSGNGYVYYTPTHWRPIAAAGAAPTDRGEGVPAAPAATK